MKLLARRHRSRVCRRPYFRGRDGEKALKNRDTIQQLWPQDYHGIVKCVPRVLETSLLTVDKRA